MTRPTNRLSVWPKSPAAGIRMRAGNIPSADHDEVAGDPTNSVVLEATGEGRTFQHTRKGCFAGISDGGRPW